jgi:hypothetical protein
MPKGSIAKFVTLPFGWTRHSYYLLSGFLLTVALVVYMWWPLAQEYLAYVDWRGPWWQYMDWLLLGIFGFMTLLIMTGANLRRDGLIVFVGMFGGLAIESWGTQTNLWFYYTSERPPLWIIPAWPIASLAIDRLARFLDHILPREWGPLYKLLYWSLSSVFYGLMLYFVAPTIDKSLTIGALIICPLVLLSPPDYRYALFTFVAGTGLGYYLELWGTTRECWLYYTLQKPPLFAVLSHGLAALAFWRAGLLVKSMLSRVTKLKERLT